MSDIIYAVLIGAFAGSFFTLIGMTFYLVIKTPVVKCSKVIGRDNFDDHYDDRA